MIERVVFDEIEYAIIIRSDHGTDGVEFLTPGDYSQQLAVMHHPQGKTIDAHVHNHEERNVVITQEVLVIKKGLLRVDFYKPESREYLGSKLLNKDDIILLSAGGHGFQVLEEVEMVEIKQGPYLGEKDKVRFDGIGVEKVVYI